MWIIVWYQRERNGDSNINGMCILIFESFNYQYIFFTAIKLLSCPCTPFKSISSPNQFDQKSWIIGNKHLNVPETCCGAAVNDRERSLEKVCTNSILKTLFTRENKCLKTRKAAVFKDAQKWNGRFSLKRIYFTVTFCNHLYQLINICISQV